MGHQVGRKARAQFEASSGQARVRARAEWQDNVGHVQASLEGAIHGTISDVEKGVYGGLADVGLQDGDVERRVLSDRSMATPASARCSCKRVGSRAGVEEGA